MGHRGVDHPIGLLRAILGDYIKLIDVDITWQTQLLTHKWMIRFERKDRQKIGRGGDEVGRHI